jgi:hypothetical protein
MNRATENMQGLGRRPVDVHTSMTKDGTVKVLTRRTFSGPSEVIADVAYVLDGVDLVAVGPNGAEIRNSESRMFEQAVAAAFHPDNGKIGVSTSGNVQVVYDKTAGYVDYDILIGPTIEQYRAVRTAQEEAQDAFNAFVEERRIRPEK